MGSVKTGMLRLGSDDYRWSIYRLPTWTRGRSTPGHALLGLAILVQLPEPNRRQLILEFDIDPARHGDMPHHQRFRVHDARLLESI